MIPWLRITPFQLVSIKRIAEHVVHACLAYKPLAQLDLTLPGDGVARRVYPHLCLRHSPSNVGAEAVAREIAHSTFGIETLRWDAPWQPDERTHFLLYLSASTFCGDHSAALADELRDARQAGIRILMVHENDPAAGSCAFGDIINQTPHDLVEAKLYGELAQAWYPPPYRDASIQLVAEVLGARLLGTCGHLSGMSSAFGSAQGAGGRGGRSARRRVGLLLPSTMQQGEQESDGAGVVMHEHSVLGRSSRL